jgi:type II secretory pathway component PulC
VVFDWQLSGVYGKGEQKSALFSRSKSKVAKDNFRKITVGDDLDGWKLTEINADKVIFKQGGSDKELLLRKPKLKASTPRTNGVIPPEPGTIPEAAPEPAADPNEITNEETPEGNQ